MRDHRNLFFKYTAYVALVSLPDLRPEPGSKVEDAALRNSKFHNMDQVFKEKNERMELIVIEHRYRKQL